ncbi:tripartite tricarboxylate transporter substrate binding protein [Beijerinckia sp. 28-YEA-48]|uniref:Bug family tripartite tricarboxylate transporter substrate binding protein n=1 Tax=unclassified Beijerinckia TaxID=2638183 RepID=UPI000899EE00|nr:tripartite-type tricarboxylate transporter receptor subunit TctC [Beijerinckia sp. GAS462]SEC27031.1 Tripartite-type tricarboxylate transporter, receptor component TctC [Beijerinckia sp. 28-YEA-48]
MTIVRVLLGMLVLGQVLGHASVMAQTYPSRSIQIIVPFPAGGLADVLTRTVGEELSKVLGQPVIAENKPGAGGNVGANLVAKATPDGYTLMMTSAGILSANQFLYKDMSFDPETAFAPISLVADMPMLVLVHKKTDIKTLQELLAAARSKPRGLNFGSAGVGTTGHLGLALLMHVSRVEVSHVPYRGAAPAVNDLVAGHVDGVVDNPPILMDHIQAGTVTPLAVAAKKRLAQLPNVPTSVEAGLPDWQISSWFGFAAPAGTSADIVKKLQGAVAHALQQPNIKKFFNDSAMVPVGNTPEEFAKYIGEERVKWRDVISEAKIQAN